MRQMSQCHNEVIPLDDLDNAAFLLLVAWSRERQASCSMEDFSNAVASPR